MNETTWILVHCRDSASLARLKLPSNPTPRQIDGAIRAVRGDRVPARLSFEVHDPDLILIHTDGNCPVYELRLAN
jgi:hypothetical protein